MRNSWASKWLVGGAALIVLIGIALQFVNKGPPQSSSPPAAVKEIAERRQLSTSVQPSAHELPAVEEGVAASDDPWAQFRTNKLSHDAIEEYLRQHGRTAQTLLAAFHSSGDTNYLNEAATRFPNDPQLQWTILARDAFPDERRKWLDLLKSSSPENSLANYLSSRDHFMNGDTHAAINELLEATRKRQFKDYTRESHLDEEELYLAAGKTPLEASRVVGWGEDLMREQASLKGVAYSMRDLQNQYLKAGDASSAEHLAQIGVILARRLNNGAAEDPGINQLVGIAMEALALSPLEQDTSYEFLGGESPAQRLDELKQQRVSLQELRRSFGAIFPNLTEAELLNWKEREKILGEVPAMRWLQQQHPASIPQGGQ